MDQEVLQPMELQRMLYAHIVFCASLEEFASVMYADIKRQKILKIPPYKDRLVQVVRVIDSLQNAQQGRKIIMSQKFPSIYRQIRDQFNDLDAVIQISSIGASLWATDKPIRDKIENAIDAILREDLGQSINDRLDTIINNYKNKLGNEEHIG